MRDDRCYEEYYWAECWDLEEEAHAEIEKGSFCGVLYKMNYPYKRFARN